MVNTMVKVQCDKDGLVHWANSSKNGPRCTKCSSTAHKTVR